jgi:hypothetical protein
MVWVLAGLQMEENSMTEKEMIEAWVKKNKPKRYTHGERPEGVEPPTISNWGRGRRKKSKAESQAEKDAEKG